MYAQTERVALSMYEAENKFYRDHHGIDAPMAGLWGDQPPAYRDRIRAMANAAILEVRVMQLPTIDV